MKLLKTILVAVDFDETLDAVLAAAGALAKKFGSEVVIMHVIEAAHRSGPALQSLRSAIAARLGQMLHQLNASGVSIPQSLCPCGNASVEIVEAAERMGAHLIVLGAGGSGTRGIGTEQHFPLGTTTETVGRWSAKPVLAVPPGPPLTFANILCPVDFSDVSARGLNTAIHLALAFGQAANCVGRCPTLCYPRLVPHGGSGRQRRDRVSQLSVRGSFTSSSAVSTSRISPGRRTSSTAIQPKRSPSGRDRSRPT